MALAIKQQSANKIIQGNIIMFLNGQIIFVLLYQIDTCLCRYQMISS